MVEYRETYKKEVDPASLGYVMKEVSSVYKSESGWELSDPVMIPNSNGTVTIAVPLSKRGDEYTPQRRF